MPTVIDALLVSLSLDGSGFTRGVKETQQGLGKVSEAGDKTRRDMDVVANKITAGFQRIRNEILGLYAVITAGRGIRELTESITTSDASVGRLAASLGMATTELSSWQTAAERSGGSAAGMTSSIQSMSSAMERMKLTGQMDEDMIAWFNRLHISLKDNAGQWKTVTQLYDDFASRFKDLSPAERSFAGSVFHMDPGTINTLGQGLAKVQELRNRAMQLGLPTDADAKRAQTLINDVADIQQAFEGLARVVLNQVTPALDAMMKKLIAWIERNGPRIRAEITDKIEAFIRWLQAVDWTAVLAGIGQVIDKFDSAVLAIEHMNPALRTVMEFVAGAWVLGMLGPIARVAAALASVGTGIAGATAGAAGLGSVVTGAAAVGGGVTAGVNLGYWIERLLRGKEVADEHARNSWFARTFGFGAASGSGASGSSGSDRSQQDDFIDRFAQKLATSRALSLINPDGTVSGSYGLGDNGSVASPGEMARAHGVRAGAGQAAIGSAEMQAREKRAFDFFKSQGWSAEDAAGITARIKRESGFREGAIGDRGTAFGLMQWHRDRQDALRAAGYDLTNASYQRQLEAIQYEMTKGREQAAGARLRAARTAGAAGDAASRYYARPGDVEGEAAATAAEATRILRRQTPLGPGAVPGPGQPTGAPFIVGSAAQRWSQVANNNVSTSSVETTINGPITINTRATDAQGVAAGLKQALQSEMNATQLNRGLA